MILHLYTLPTMLFYISSAMAMPYRKRADGKHFCALMSLAYFNETNDSRNNETKINNNILLSIFTYIRRHV
jgi:hypothetical protein